MAYTHKWNGAFIKSTEGLKGLRTCIEIGCFEGLTSNYICENMLADDGLLICIDPLKDEYLVENLSEADIKNNAGDYAYFSGQHRRFIDNTRHNINTGRLRLIRESSSIALDDLYYEYYDKVDFIYIDGDHRTLPAYLDGKLSLKLCKSQGLILFDDYLWHDANGNSTTKDGIDRFLNEFKDQIEVVAKDYQVMVRKL